MQIAHYQSSSELQQHALALCVEALQRALATQAQVTLLLSGGSTPLPLYRALATAALDWSRIAIALVDERWVDVSHVASNERAVRDALVDHITPLRFVGMTVGMKSAHADVFAAQAAVDAAYAALPPIALAVLGMGVDGHVASWFPHAQGLDDALTRNTRCAAIRATPSAVTGVHVERMTVTRHLLSQAQQLLLLFSGADKWRTFMHALVQCKSCQAHASDCQAQPVAALFTLDVPLQVMVMMPDADVRADV